MYEVTEMLAVCTGSSPGTEKEKKTQYPTLNQEAICTGHRPANEKIVFSNETPLGIVIKLFRGTHHA